MVDRGAVQMTIDSRLLDWHIQHQPSTWLIRFYDWSPPALSLGYHQRSYPPAWDTIAQKLAIDIIRRPTGGRAVLHQGSLTYAIVCPQLYSSRGLMYEYLCGFLIKGFQQLGMALGFGSHDRYDRHASCWHSHTQADLVSQRGTKIIGSAQLYRKNSVLQQGSILIQPDRKVWDCFFAESIPPEPPMESEQFANLSFMEIQQKIIATLSGIAQEYFPVEFSLTQFDQILPCLLSPKLA